MRVFVLLCISMYDDDMHYFILIVVSKPPYLLHSHPLSFFELAD